ncbi:hypothetical protein B5M42_020890 [Paenibacillus athensensis]|uniref:Uncharacterized protein n=1 Tax=Paenibacillus athensensis TaxID=1967502 RepID=A0A4Y8PYJ6_9BACL|nr:hypothetical protein [Paenibacillus athensensis]MCD1261261.1 hypothetical protein [Paenibacillus athensensis]
MNGLPAWMAEAFRNRFDSLCQHIHENPKQQAEWRLVDVSFERLRKTMSDEQRRWFLEWDALMGFQTSKEKEELYLHGFMDGIQVYACLGERNCRTYAVNLSGNAGPSE